MSHPTRRSAEGESPLARNRMIPLLVAITLILAYRYVSQRDAPPAAEQANQQQAPQQQASTVEAGNAAPPVAEASSSAEPKVAARPKASAAKPAATNSATTNTAGESPLVIRSLSLKDQDGKVVYRGDIDLRPTVERIVAGRKLRFSNDGSTFQNREGRLPRKPSGYYREWVVPTPGEDGPGPQRIVTGDHVDEKPGEFWYTPDHYRTFQRLPGYAHSSAPKDKSRKEE